MPIPSANARETRRRDLPVVGLAALAILLIAGLAGANLWCLVYWNEQTARSTATLSVLDYGTLLTRHFARQSFLQTSQPNPADTEHFNQAAELLRNIEPGLAYITLAENDVVLYHTELAAAPAAAPERRAAPEPKSVILKNLQVGGEVVPVIAFVRMLKGGDGRERRLELALKKTVVEREQAAPAQAMAKMFHVSLLTLGAAFGVCLLAVIWIVRLTLTWERRRRQDEHLAFAGAVASSIIHDFRNPMSSMQLDAQLLQQEAGRGQDARPARMSELAERINATIGRLDILLLEFLLVAKPEVVEQERFDINAGLRDNMDLLKLQFEKANIRIDLALSEQSLPIRGFPVQFTRALLNILKNAEHYSPAGGKVAVRTRVDGGEGVVEITDEGPGIAPRDRRRVFDLFYSNRPGGTGIGLALTKTAVENCGGTVAVTPGPNGKGSCFVIRVPLA